MTTRPEPIRLGDDPGITARAIRGPRGTLWYWQARYTIAGERLERSLGWLTRDKAQRAAAKLLAEGLPVPEAKLEVRTLRDLFRLWGREQADRKESGQIRPRTLVFYRGAVRRLNGDAPGSAVSLADILLEQLGADDLVRYRDRSGLAAGTVAADLAIASQIWSWGRKRGYAPARDWPEIIVRPGPTREKVTPTPGDVAAVVAWLELHATPWVVLGVRLLACGPRLGEVATITWERVDLEEGFVVVDEKTGPREVAIFDRKTIAALRARWEAAGRPRRGGIFGVVPLTVRNAHGGLGDWIGRACKALGIRHWTPHGLRRLVDDQLLEAGADPGVLMSHQGHGIGTAIRLYRTVNRTKARAVVERSGAGVLPAGELVELRVVGRDVEGEP